MADKKFKIKELNAPENIESNTNNTSWLYEKTGIAINDFDKDDKVKKNSIEEEKYKEYYDSLTEEEKFAKTRDATEIAGRPLTMTVDEWNELPSWKKSWHTISKVGVPGAPGGGGYDNPFYKGPVIGAQNAMHNAFSLPLEISDALGMTEGATEAFAKVLASMDPLKPENSTEAITAVLTQYGVPAASIGGWLNKFKGKPGFWRATGRYARTLLGMGVADAVVAGAADTNLATAFGISPLPSITEFLTIHEDDPSLVRRAKIGTEMIWVGPVVDTLLMMGGGAIKLGNFFRRGKNEKITYMENGVEKEFYANERTFAAVAKILNEMSDGPRTTKEIVETMKIFENSGIIPPTGSAAGSPGLVHLQNLFSRGAYNDVTIKNLLAMNENLDTLLKKNGNPDGINTTFLTQEMKVQSDNINQKIKNKENVVKTLQEDLQGNISESKTKATENANILNSELTTLKNERNILETEINNKYVVDINAAKMEVESYISSVGQVNNGLSKNLANSIDEGLVKQFTYLTYYKNQLYKNIDVKDGVKIIHNLNDFKTGNTIKKGKKQVEETVVDLLKNDIDFFIKKRNNFDEVAGTIPKSLINRLKNLTNPKNKDPLTLSVMEEARSAFTEAYKNAIDNNQSLLADRILRSKKQIFDNLYDNISNLKNEDYASLAINARNASEWFKTEYAPRFEEGVASMWAEAFKTRKSGSLLSSSPEQSPTYFLKVDGRGLRINASAEAGVNKLEEILNPPKNELGEFLNGQLIDEFTKKSLNLADKENIVQIVENFFAAEIAQLIHGSDQSVSQSLKILERMQSDYFTVIQKYPNIGKKIEEYKTTIKEKNAEVLNTTQIQKENKILENKTTKKILNEKKDLIAESKIKEQENINAINASFSEKINIASKELDLISNQTADSLRVFSYFVEDNPLNAIKKVFNSADPVAEMSLLRQKINELGIDNASEGLNEAVSQWLKSQVETGNIISSTATVKYQGSVGKYEVGFEGVNKILADRTKVDVLYAAGWTADDVSTLTNFNEQLAILARESINTKSSATKSNLIDEAGVAKKSQILAASIWGIVKGRGIMALTNMLGGALGISPMKAATEVLEEAMVHPELAKILMMRETEESIKKLNTYLVNNFPIMYEEKKEFKEQRFDIKETTDEIGDQSKAFIQDPVNVNVPTANSASSLASTNILSPITNNVAMNPNNLVRNTDQGKGTIDKGRAAIAFGPNDMLAQPTMAAQGGIMNARKQIQRVA